MIGVRPECERKSLVLPTRLFLPFSRMTVTQPETIATSVDTPSANLPLEDLHNADSFPDWYDPVSFADGTQNLHDADSWSQTYAGMRGVSGLEARSRGVGIAA